MLFCCLASNFKALSDELGLQVVRQELEARLWVMTSELGQYW